MDIKSSKTSCYNLDFNTMSTAEIKKLFKLKTQNTDINLVEGNKGFLMVLVLMDQIAMQLWRITQA
jgi:cobyrinic acid a,c-diamide synthase